MKSAEILIWALLAAIVAWLAYDRFQGYAQDDCQAYDRLGNGIGCEGPDIGDR